MSEQTTDELLALIEEYKFSIKRYRMALEEIVNVLGPEKFGGGLKGMVAEGNDALRVAKSILKENP